MLRTYTIRYRLTGCMINLPTEITWACTDKAGGTDTCRLESHEIVGWRTKGIWVIGTAINLEL
jgi:hypothetical protein